MDFVFLTDFFFLLLLLFLNTVGYGGKGFTVSFCFRQFAMGYFFHALGTAFTLS